MSPPVALQNNRKTSSRSRRKQPFQHRHKVADCGKAGHIRLGRTRNHDDTGIPRLPGCRQLRLRCISARILGDEMGDGVDPASSAASPARREWRPLAQHAPAGRRVEGGASIIRAMPEMSERLKNGCRSFRPVVSRTRAPAACRARPRQRSSNDGPMSPSPACQPGRSRRSSGTPSAARRMGIGRDAGSEGMRGIDDKPKCHCFHNVFQHRHAAEATDAHISGGRTGCSVTPASEVMRHVPCRHQRSAAVPARRACRRE